jgi:hypothetical protein
MLAEVAVAVEVAAVVPAAVVAVVADYQGPRL